LKENAPLPNKHQKINPPVPEYIDKAKALSRSESDRLMSRMRGRFTHQYEDEHLTRIQVLALQLAYEDEQLKDWRKNMAILREKHKNK
jgi:hypothetical protein